MAWIVWRRDASNTLTAQVKWRDPDTRAIRSRALGPSTDETAEAARREVERETEERVAGPATLPAGRALAAFLGHLRFLRRSPRTVRYYRHLLAPMFRYLESRAQMRRWAPRHLEAYIATHPAWSPRTIQMRVFAARRFVRWAPGRVTCPDFVGDLRGPAVRTTETRHYSPAQVRELLAAMEGYDHEVAVALAALAGLSLSDLRALRWEQVNIAAGMIVGVRRKTKVPYRVPILPALAEVLRRARPRSGKGLVCHLPPRDDAARNVAVRACRRAGLPGGGWHRLRHSFGALLDEAGASLAQIRTAMGHAPQSSVTLRYLHADDGRAGDVARAAQRALDGGARAPAAKGPARRSRIAPKGPR